MYLLLNVVGEAQIGKEKEAANHAWEVKQFWAILILSNLNNDQQSLTHLGTV